jgi:hypothetical protein
MIEVGYLTSIISFSPKIQIGTWNAAFNPVFLTIQRKDWATSSISDDGGNVKITLSGSPGLPTLSGQVYVFCGSINGTYDILSNDSTSITIDLAYPQTYNAGFVNYVGEGNMYVETEIVKITPNTTTETSIATRRDVLDPTGFGKIYISPYAQRLVSGKDPFNYASIVYRSENLYCVLKPKISVVNAPSEIGTVTFQYSYPENMFGFANAAMPILHPDGSKMIEFTTVPGGAYLANWLTEFKNPRIYLYLNSNSGYYEPSLPFDLAFIYSEQCDKIYANVNTDGGAFSTFVTHDISADKYFGVCRIQPDLGGVSFEVKAVEIFVYQQSTAATTSTYTIASGLFKVKPNSINLGVLSFPLSGTECNDIAALATLLNSELPAWYSVTSSGNDLIISYAAGVRRASTLYLTLNSDTTPSDDFRDATYDDNTVGADAITEIKICKPIYEICKNPVWLKWLNTKGGYDYWLFEQRQYITPQAKSLGEFSRYYDDISTQDNTSELLGKEAGDSMQIGCSGVDYNDWLGLKTLFNSKNVQMLINPDTWIDDGAKWMTVIVEPGKMPTIRNDKTMHFVEMILQLPKINLQES